MIHKYVPAEGTVSVVIRKGRMMRSYRLHRRFMGLGLDNFKSEQEVKNKNSNSASAAIVKERFTVLKEFLGSSGGSGVCG